MLLLPCVFAQNENNTFPEREGMYLGMSFGTWFPDGHNKVLGNPLIFGPALFLKYDRSLFSFEFDLISLEEKNNSVSPFQVKLDDSVVTQNDFFGYNIMLGYGYQVWSFNHFEMNALFSLGYGRLSYYNPDQYTDIGKSSLIMSPGLNLMYYGRAINLQLKSHFDLVNYAMRDKVSTDLRGNYFRVKLILSTVLTNN